MGGSLSVESEDAITDRNEEADAENIAKECIEKENGLAIEGDIVEAIQN